ncbi:hypothetical protein N7481_012766 [Penicillium waksmanii]|uniref:uncharacterized protein n=1 Tax=Penicillium waksmanii TaxID=69791 RepID=UPI002548FD2B|nr:uncharacterized protein N7481_012766 [Penicillium waksmanii]KAJ5966052.1 hypothetical protein N7481_012766 [Penicillium waksmanii]
MPRIRPSALIKAYRDNPLLPLLLKECRTLESARNELRWLREHALRTSQTRTRQQPEPNPTRPEWKMHLISMCRQRSRGYPLQYILGDQPFGDLEILCRPGVLIPRPDTESYVIQAAKLVEQMAMTTAMSSESSSTDKIDPKPLRILDLCTGTGCITLLLHALLSPRFKHLRVMGIDISSKALSLARKNLDHNLQQGLLTHRASTDIQFHRADVLGLPTGGGGSGGGDDDDEGIPNVEKILSEYFDQPGETGTSEDAPLDLEPGCDLLISNPPYISTSDFRNGTTARSVRLFEPKLALVPPPPPPQSRQSPTPTPAMGHVRPEDIFYRRILELSYKLRTKVTVLECGDIKQAGRVVEMHNFMAPERDRFQDHFDVQVWPNTEQDMAFYGFHHNEGSRCVIIQRGIRSSDSK